MKHSSHNIALKDKNEQITIQIDMATASVAYEEKYNQTTDIPSVKKTFPVEWHDYFDTQLEYYRKLSSQIGKLDSIEE